MNKSVTVIDRNGKSAVRPDGVLLDGDVVRVPTMLADAKPSTGAILAGPATPETLGSARRILGDQFVAGDFAGLSDALAQHTVVRKRLGNVANGRPSQFLDAAWQTMARAHAGPGRAADLPVLTDAQMAMAADGVQRALTDHGTKQVPVLQDIRGAYRARVADQHKSSTDRALLDGCSYEERMAIKSGARHSDVKVGDQKLSDADFYQRQRDYSAQRGAATA